MFSLRFTLLFVTAIEPSLSAPIQPKITSINTSKICALTGPEALADQKSFDICGTDLGTMTELKDRIYFAFGDTFGYDGDVCRGIGGPNWRSNTFASTSDLDPQTGVRLTDWLKGPDGRAIAIIQGAHQLPFAADLSEQTKIPTGTVSAGGTIYLHYMSVHGFAPRGGVWECNYSKWVYSDDEGKTWHECASRFGGQDSNFNMLALTSLITPDNPEGRFVYALGTPCGRFGTAQLGRAPIDSVLDSSKWEYLNSSSEEAPAWSEDPANAVDVISAPVGEASVLWNPQLQRWMYTYLKEDSASLVLLEGEHLWGPWTEPHTLVTAKEYPQLYGAFMTPSFLKNHGRTLYFVMSQYGLYNTFIMRADLSF
ncbi:MAG: DUF4185 domain-containing protein [Verrucomicrobia bacterium]|nr:DUF4185 domain-containing protein [Verrucomicrobiota bacterium]